MKKVILSISSCAILALTISLQHGTSSTIEAFHLKPQNSGGAAAGKTGAPGEQNCTACHSGTAQDGANENVLTVLDGSTPVTQYAPGQQYTVTLAMASNPTKKGFQSTALTSSNTMAGTFTGQTGNTSVNGTTKKYANHTSSSNTSTTAPLWSWTWTAPASGSGDVTFYVATNKTNNNNNDMGDMIYLSQHVFSEASTTGLNENNKQALQVVYNQELNSISASFESLSANSVSMRLIDMTGKVNFTSDLGISEIGKNKLTFDLNKSLKKGIYIATIQIGRKVFSEKIIVQ